MKILIIFFAALLFSLNSFAALVVSTRTYSGSVETVKYTNGSSATFNSTSAPVTWASDHITKTITYNFADGTRNAVVSSQQPNQSGGSYSTSIYPSNWTSTGIVVTKPVTSPISFTYGDGFVNTQSGTVSSPFDENLLAAKSVTDPNAVIKTPSNINYDLTWGTPDKNGPTFANLFGNTIHGSITLNNINVMGYLVNGNLGAPNQEVLNAWNQGWTGQGKNILMVDNYLSTDEYSHGVTTMLIANRYAFGAAMYGVDLAGGGVKAFNGANLTSGVNINVVSMSETFGPANYYCNNGCGITPSDSVYNSAISASASINNAIVNLLLQTTTPQYANNLANAVIVKSAGNDAIDSKYDLTSLAFSQNSSTLNRLLIVGALNNIGTTASPANLASYSNKAGTDLNIQNHFLLESGNAPGSFYVNGVSYVPSSSQGTSYAAPRVAGYVAIVEQKFPNLTATNTANILLQTARYDTLSCFYTAGGCSPSIYGQGEASLSRALAPVGRLR